MPRIPLLPVAVASLLVSPALASPAAAAPIFAGAVVSAVSTTPFTGGNVLGAPDRSGLVLASASDPDPLRTPGTLVLRFELGLLRGEGPDLVVFDMDRSTSDPAEEASVDVSHDGNTWTPLGAVIGGTAEGRIDFPSALAEPVFFVRITQISGFSLDLDAVQGSHPVPEPESAALLAAGLALLAGARRRAVRAPRDPLR